MTAPTPQTTGDLVLEVFRDSNALTVIAPFIKVRALSKILSVITDGAGVEVFTRWLPAEVASGVTDLEVLELVESIGGRVYLHPLVHAKAYLNGRRALVGSSNGTMTGLGWGPVAAIEGLFEIPPDDERLQDLLAVLKAASCRANETIQTDVRLQSAELAPEDMGWELDPRVGSEPAAGNGSSITPVSPFWVPQFNVPESAWGAYKGERSEQVRTLVMRDLEALGIEPGIDKEDVFRAVVGATLQQGFTGKLIQECAGLNAIDAAERMRSLLSGAGLEVPEGRLGERYQAFARWVTYFVADRTLRATGFSIM